jgi:hypothetical protein
LSPTASGRGSATSATVAVTVAVTASTVITVPSGHFTQVKRKTSLPSSFTRACDEIGGFVGHNSANSPTTTMTETPSNASTNARRRYMGDV